VAVEKHVQEGEEEQSLASYRAKPAEARQHAGEIEQMPVEGWGKLLGDNAASPAC
jgi:hypothetical protein